MKSRLRRRRLWVATRVAEMMAEAHLERCDGRHLAEIPGEIGLQLWAIEDTAGAARRGLRAIVEVWLFLAWERSEEA